MARLPKLRHIVPFSRHLHRMIIMYEYIVGRDLKPIGEFIRKSCRNRPTFYRTYVVTRTEFPSNEAPNPLYNFFSALTDPQNPKSSLARACTSQPAKRNKNKNSHPFLYILFSISLFLLVPNKLYSLTLFG